MASAYDEQQAARLLAKEEAQQGTKRLIKTLLFVLAGLLIGLVVLFNLPVTTVSPGNVGVICTWGNCAKDSLGAGIHIKVPFSQSVHEVYVGTMTGSVDSAGSSHDMQQVNMKVGINYNVDPTHASYVYTQYNGNPWLAMSPIIQEAIKATSAKYTAEDLLTKRDMVSTALQDAVVTRLRTFGIFVTSVNIVDFQFSQQFNDAIEAKITAQQHALRAENEVKQTQWEQQKLVVMSEAAVTVAQNHAKEIELEGQALAQNPAVLERLKIDKWDGHYPTTMLGGNATPLIQLK